MITLQITRAQNKTLRTLLEGHAATIKNWTVSAVEAGDLERAQRLVRDLREIEKMFHIVKPDEMVKED